jgi:hypothetical protein
MNTDFEISGSSCDREGQDALHFKEGPRKMILYCSLAFSKIEFFYHDIKQWDYPHQLEPVTEEDRARLAARITEYYAGKGWDVVIDRRRFCPHCREILAGSQYDNWAGGICDFCGKEIDRSGKVVRHPEPERGFFQKLKDRLRRSD